MAIKNNLKDVTAQLDSFINGVEENITGKNLTPYESALNLFIKRVRENLRKNKLIASNNLLQSIQPLPSKVSKDKITLVIEIEDYYKDVEEGTKPKGYSKENRKKLQPKILEWIGNKPELQRLAGDKLKQRSLSYAIATNILKKGTIKRFGYKGVPFLTSEIPQLQQDITNALPE